jgi:F1F0 ATPase subunit 2
MSATFGAYAGQGVLFLTLGFALGLLYFAGLRRNLDNYLDGRHPWRAVLFHISRLLLAGLAFTAIAFAGAVALLAAAGGFFAARVIAVRRARAEP